MASSLTVWIALRHPVCYGGGGLWVNALESLMEERLSGFGDALKQLEIDISFATELPPLKTFEQTWPQYHKGLAKLPKARFLRIKGSLKLDLLADFAMAETALDAGHNMIPPALHGQPGLLRKVSHLRQEYLPAVTSLIVANLATLKRRFRKTDHFDTQGFLAAAAQLVNALPTGGEEASLLVGRRDARHKAMLAADPWAAVDVDWDDFHATARALLDDPWYWDCADDWAPHGNDAGSDVLHDMCKRLDASWQDIHEALECLTTNGMTWLDTNGAKALEVAEADDQGYVRCEQTLIAAAFAEIKLTGAIAEYRYQLAYNALKRLGTPEIMGFWCGHRPPDDQAEWRKRHAQMSAKLEEVWTEGQP